MHTNILKGGSLVRERDWLLLFDDPNILPYKGTVVLAMTMSDCTAVNARKGGGGGGGGGGRYSISRGGVSAGSTIAYVLTEFMPRGRLSDLCRTGPVDPRLCVQYAMDLANGLRVRVPTHPFPFGVLSLFLFFFGNEGH